MLYCAKHGPDLIDEEVFSTSFDAWINVFEICAAENGVEWRRKYWKRVKPFRQWAARRGFRVVPVRVVEI